MSRQDSLFENQEPKTRDQGPVECLGETFDSDEARREYFLGLLRKGLEELHAKLGGVPFTTVEDAVERMKSVEKWPMGDDARLRELAERIRHADSSKDLLQRWKDEVGFPHGEIEDILSLSDPPYYTACPNPFIADFIKHYGKPYNPETDNYRREPFAADVSEGKNDPIYNAHSYHTKVPHKAIMRYILHYTEPGDVVFDGFCGTGMTGVAAQLCGDRKTVESLGFKVDSHGNVCQEEADDNARTTWRPFSKLGPRQVLLNDLSPAATFIAYNYNTPRDRSQFERRAKHALQEVEHECGWMFVTLHKPSPSEIERACTIIQSDSPQNIVSAPSLRLGRINYVVWSDVFSCPECAGEIVFWDAAVDKTTWQVKDEFLCPHCSTTVKKRELERTFETRIDPELNRTIKQAKQVPTLIHYFVGKERHLKKPDDFDFALLDRISSSDIPHPVPTDRMPDGDEARRNDPLGITHVHHFYTKRNLWCLAAFSSRQGAPRHNVNVSSVASVITKMYRFRSQGGSLGAGGGPLTGTLYVPSLTKEIPIIKVLGEHVRKWAQLYDVIKTNSRAWLSTGSNTFIPILTDNVVDYIFTDPPFGGNLMYSELNFLWEAWIKVFTNNKPEAITNKVQGKGLPEYQRLMTECFREYYRVLKPGRWMTVEFHNSKNSVWSSIQEALQRAGFVVADVRTLDKKQRSFQQVINGGAVKQDLVISAYKPNGGLEERFKLTAGTEEGVWDFVRTHLKQLPVFVSKDGKAEVIAERQNYLLFDRMVAFHVQRGVTVPLSAAEFYAGLAQRFPERDGMYFLPEQVAEYDKKRMKVERIEKQVFIPKDEETAIKWLRQELREKPSTFQQIHPDFTRLVAWLKHEKPLELSELLEQNFLRYDGKGEVPSQIHSYLSSNFKELRNLPKDDERLRAKAKDRWYVPDPNKAGDLEKLRERALLREFEEYRESKQKRLKVFRLEAVRAGFKKAWQERDYATIIAVARKIPENVLQEDPKLLMWYDQALTRSGEDG